MTPHSNHPIEIQPVTPNPQSPQKPRNRALRVVLGLAAIGLVVLGLLRAFGPAQKQAEPGSGPKPERKPSVRVVELRPRPFSVVLEGLGTVTPLATVTVKSQVDGPLVSVAYREGHDVRKGQLLAEIDPRPFRIRLAQARATVARDRAQLKNAQLDLNRYENLVGRKLIAQQQLDAQRSQVDQLLASVAADEANVADAELQLQYTRILSPIDGVAGIRLVDPGNLVRASDTSGIVVLTQLDPIAVVFTLPQDDLPRLSLAMADGTPKVLAVDRSGDRVLGEGTLKVIDNQINTQTASVRLKAEFKNADRKLWPNLFVRARIDVAHRDDALILPASAVQHGPNGSYVYVLTADDVARMQPIKVALLQGEDALIESGLTGGERVVVDGQEQIKPNTQVVPRDSAADKGRAASEGRRRQGGPEGQRSGPARSGAAIPAAGPQGTP